MIRRIGFVLALAGIFGTSMSAAAQSDVQEALGWLRTQQASDGGFSNGFSEGSDVGATADAVVAIASAGEDPSTWKHGGLSTVDYLAGHAGEVEDPGLMAKVALAAVAAGQDPRAFGGVDLLGTILGAFDPGTGYFGGGPYDSALSILALRAAQEPLPPKAVDGLLAARQAEGSYSFSGDPTPGTGDSNTTGLVVQALLVAGAGGEAAPSLDYFRRVQNADGGWTYQKPSAFGEDTDANSTALGIQALLAAGQDLAAWGHPERALQALQLENGALMFNAAAPGENLLATVQAIPALANVDMTDVALLPLRWGADAGRASGQAILVATLVLIGGLLLGAALLGRPPRAES